MITDQLSVVRYRTREKLDISIAEFCFLDIVYNLSNNPQSKHPGWAYASNAYYEKLLGIGERGLQKMKNRMIKRGLLERHSITKQFLRTSMTWYRVHVMGMDPEQSSPPTPNKVRPAHELSAPNIHRDTPINREMGQVESLMDIKHHLMGSELLEDSIENRMIIWELIEPHIEAEWFVAQFKYSIGTIKVKAPIETIVNEWIRTGHWYNVYSLSINKIGGWIQTTGKRISNGPKPQESGERTFQEIAGDYGDPDANSF